jgi:hypothetical protein
VDGAVRRLALRHVPESRDTESAPGLDVAGTAVGAVGLGALTYGLTGLGERGPDPLLLAAVVLGVLALVVFVLVERVGAENHVTGSDQRLLGQPTSRSPPAPRPA